MPVKVIACESMKEELLALNIDTSIEFDFVPMGLHLHPNKLKEELQQKLDNSIGYSRIIFAFGLCGGATSGLKAKIPITIPKVHDCFPLFLGSSKRMKEIKLQKGVGTFYLSNGFMNGDESLNMFKEYDRIAERFGEKRAIRMFNKMFENYNEVLYIETEVPSKPSNIHDSKKIAEMLNISYTTVNGHSSYLDKLINGPWDEEDFITVNPDEPITEELFGL